MNGQRAADRGAAEDDFVQTNQLLLVLKQLEHGVRGLKMVATTTQTNSDETWNNRQTVITHSHMGLITQSSRNLNDVLYNSIPFFQLLVSQHTSKIPIRSSSKSRGSSSRSICFGMSNHVGMILSSNADTGSLGASGTTRRMPCEWERYSSNKRSVREEMKQALRELPGT